MADRRNDTTNDDVSDEMEALMNDVLKDVPASVVGTAQELVERHTRCVICGAHLHFSHLTDFARNVTQETARCPECGVKVRNQTFRLQ